jgi:preprotein translocase subunit SecE
VADKDEAQASGSASDADLPPELVESDATDADAVASDELEPAELETAGVGVAAGGSGRTAAPKPAPQPKGTPTAKRDAAPTQKRTTPAAFVKQSVGELRKVVYPTGQQLGNYFLVVLVFVLFVIAYVSLLDLGIGKLVFAIFS